MCRFRSYPEVAVGPKSSQDRGGSDYMIFWGIAELMAYIDGLNAREACAPKIRRQKYRGEGKNGQEIE